MRFRLTGSTFPFVVHLCFGVYRSDGMYGMVLGKVGTAGRFRTISPETVGEFEHRSSDVKKAFRVSLVSPSAVEAGVTDRIWTIQKIAEQLDKESGEKAA